MTGAAAPLETGPDATPVCGVDFTSAPSRRKPITVAHGVRAGTKVHLQRVDAHAAFEGFAAWLGQPGRWTGAFDFPFGLPRELVVHLGWPLDWPALMGHYASLPRAELRRVFAAYCAARPAGAKFAHRATDRPAGASPSMKWVNPPVAYMMHAGVPLLIGAGVSIPRLHERPAATRVALEGYPGLLARELIGRRSYKSDSAARHTAERTAARQAIVAALEQGRTRLGLQLCLRPAQRNELVADASGDRLDAALCMVQAAWAVGQPRHGLPAQVDPLEGWIVTA